MISRVKTIVVCLFLIVIITLAFGGGCTLGRGLIPEETEGLDVVAQAWQILHEDYITRDKLDDQALSQGAIEGMLEALDDPYTSYLDADAYKLGLTGLEGKFEGIGAHVGVRDEKLMIIAPIAGSPADRAGIRAGDIILEVDGQSTAEMSLAEAVLNIRGDKGTTVKLLILHEGETEPVLIEVVRDVIEVPSVRFEMKGDIALINITNFAETTYEEMAPVMEQIAGNGATGVILDMRSNPGGLLKAVVDTAGYFLEDGLVVVHVVDKEGQRTSQYAERHDAATSLPMVVLVDSYSASGSEVLAGALQDHHRATIAGTVTFGKGSVNILRPLKDGGGLYVTTARWLTPDGNLIEGVGLTPDIELDLENVDAVEWAIDYLEAE